MNTHETLNPPRLQAIRRPEDTAVFDRCMLALAGLLFATVASAASILVTLPEALEAVAAPAFGAPWMTASIQPSTPRVQAACGAN